MVKLLYRMQTNSVQRVLETRKTRRRWRTSSLSVGLSVAGRCLPSLSLSPPTPCFPFSSPLPLSPLFFPSVPYPSSHHCTFPSLPLPILANPNTARGSEDALSSHGVETARARPPSAFSCLERKIEHF